MLDCHALRSAIIELVEHGHAWVECGTAAAQLGTAAAPLPVVLHAPREAGHVWFVEVRARAEARRLGID